MVKSVVTLCTHLAWPTCLAVQMNCTPVKDAQVQKCGVATVFVLSCYARLMSSLCQTLNDPKKTDIDSKVTLIA